MIRIVLSDPQTIRAHRVFRTCSETGSNAQGTRSRSLGQARGSGPLFPPRSSAHDGKFIRSGSPDIEEDIVRNGEQPRTDSKGSKNQLQTRFISGYFFFRSTSEGGMGLQYPDGAEDELQGSVRKR